MQKLSDRLPLLGARQYCNPLKINLSGPAAPDPSLPGIRFNPDPYVIEYNGTYYCYASGESAVPVLSSGDLVEWTYRGEALREPGHRSYWAPAVIYYNGLFYMYYSSLCNDQTDDHDHLLKVAVAEDPTGPFDYRKTLFDSFSIDAHVVRDAKGDFYLFYSTNNFLGTEFRRPGTVILVDRMIDPLTPAGTPSLAVKPTLDEEIFERNRFGDGRNWHTIEGAFHLSRKGRHYLMYSGNAYTHPSYFIGYAVSQDGRDWTKYPNDQTYAPLLRSNETVEGTGHNSVVKAPNQVDDWLIYHGRDVAAGLSPGQERRMLRMDQLHWRGDALWVAGPSFVAQDAPALPTFRERFDQGMGGPLSSAWEPFAGQWSTYRGEAFQADAACIAAALIRRHELENCLFTVNCKWEESHLGGVYGIYAAYADPRNNVQVLLNAGRRQLQAFALVNGVKTEVIRVDLEPGFNFRCFHSLRVAKTGSLFQVAVDDVSRITAVFPCGKGRFGLVTYFTKAYFAGIALTEHLSLDRQTQPEFVRFLNTGDFDSPNIQAWEIQDGVLSCLGSQPLNPQELWFQGFHPESFQLRLDFHCVRLEGEGYLGFYPVYRDRGNYLALRLYGRKLELECRRSNLAEFHWEEPFPADFSLRGRHTLWIKKLTRAIAIFVDEYLVYHGKTDFTGYPGIVCSVSACFEQIEITRL